MEDYEWAIRKHGIDTVMGSLETLLDPKFLSGASAFVAALGLTSGSATATTAATTFVIGKATASIGRAMLDIKDFRRGKNPELAFVHQIKQSTKHDDGSG